ncbi:MAG: type 1 glutamine amidotransferase [Mycobacteriales bacterium]
MAAPRLLVVQHTESESAGRLGGWLTDAGADLVAVRPFAGDELPQSIDGYDGLLVLGGPQFAYVDDNGAEGAPWLSATKALLRDAVTRQTPTLAICLGAQLLAEACGGRVRPGSQGPEYGAQLVARRDTAAQDELFGLVPFTPDVIAWHEDEIVELPAGATLLASGTTYPHQAFRVGERAWGMQFHIETTPDQVSEWAEELRADPAAEGLDVDRILAAALAVHDDVREVWQPVAARFAALAGATLAAPGGAAP